jgi:hypothetical protein
VGIKLFLSCLSCLSSLAFAVSVNAQTTPKVVFFGDTITYYWSMCGAICSPFFVTGPVYEPNWINKGVAGTETTAQELARFQSDVVSLHPAIVHIIPGFGDLAPANPSEYNNISPLALQAFESNVSAMITEAKNANIKVVLGTVGPQGVIANDADGLVGYNLKDWSVVEPVQTFEANAWIESYGAANNIPVINYHDSLCGCVGSVDLSTDGHWFLGTPSYPLIAGVTPSPFGYTSFDNLVAPVIHTINLALKSGYLGNNGYVIPDVGQGLSPVNTVQSGSLVPFTAYGTYSDGATRPMLNTNFAGMNGIWTSSNPNVMHVDIFGTAYALIPGKATISFTSLSGVQFSPWVMTVQPAP